MSMATMTEKRIGERGPTFANRGALILLHGGGWRGSFGVPRGVLFRGGRELAGV